MPTKFDKENSTTSSVIENIIIVKQLSGVHYYTLNSVQRWHLILVRIDIIIFIRSYLHHQ